MMHDGIGMTIFHAGHSLIFGADWTHALVAGSILQGDSPGFSKLLRCFHTFAIKTPHVHVFILVEHGHLFATPPTPEHVHGLS